ncbi:MAG: CDP-alcohol phosphatidyltransferase family protein [Ignavibacteriaceae bacterium]
MKFTSKEIFTISNGISLLRFLLVIPFWFLLDHFDSQSVRYITFFLCLFAAATDMLDGYLARKLNQVTEVGKIIDPLADKTAMALIVIKLYLIGEISDFYFYSIILRDILIFSGGIYVTSKIGKVLPSNKLGKITVLNIGFVILLIIIGFSRNHFIYQFFYYSSIILIFASFIAYVIRAKEFIAKKNNESI